MIDIHTASKDELLSWIGDESLTKAANDAVSFCTRDGVAETVDGRDEPGFSLKFKYADDSELGVFCVVEHGRVTEVSAPLDLDAISEEISVH